jgi:CBS-domain-containing membrane protein
MPEISLGHAIVISTFVLAATYGSVRMGRAILVFARYMVDRGWPKDPEQVVAEGIAQAAIEPIEVGRLLDVQNEALMRHDELIEMNRDDIDTLLKEYDDRP